MHPSSSSRTEVGVEHLWNSDSIILVALICCIFGFSVSSAHPTGSKPIPKPPSVANLSVNGVLTHVENLLQLTELNLAYDISRLKARDYIVATLTSNGFSGEQVLFHKFAWTDKLVETKGSQEVTLETTWSGVNILAWTNTSVLLPGSKPVIPLLTWTMLMSDPLLRYAAMDHSSTFSIVAARYDSQGWWSEHHGNTYSCTTELSNPSRVCERNTALPTLSSRVKSLRTSMDLMGASLLLELARQVASFQQDLKETLASKSALELLYYWDKHDPRTIETGIYEEIPILFIFFDQEVVGNLGSQVWTEFYDIAAHCQQNEIVSLTSVDVGNWKPFEPPTSPGNSTPTWKNLSPSFFLDPHWLVTLLSTPSDVEMEEDLL